MPRRARTRLPSPAALAPRGRTSSAPWAPATTSSSSRGSRDLRPGAGRRLRAAQGQVTVLSTPAREGSGIRSAPTTSASWTRSRAVRDCPARPAARVRARLLPEGRAYFGAMAAAANFACANRQAIAHAVRQAIGRVFGPSAASGTRRCTTWPTTSPRPRHHGRELLVHRKGATRAFRPDQRRSPPPIVGGPAGVHPGQHGHRRYVLAASRARWSQPSGRPATAPGA